MRIWRKKEKIIETQVRPNTESTKFKNLSESQKTYCRATVNVLETINLKTVSQPGNEKANLSYSQTWLSISTDVD